MWPSRSHGSWRFSVRSSGRSRRLCHMLVHLGVWCIAWTVPRLLAGSMASTGCVHSARQSMAEHASCDGLIETGTFKGTWRPWAEQMEASSAPHALPRFVMSMDCPVVLVCRTSAPSSTPLIVRVREIGALKGDGGASEAGPYLASNSFFWRHDSRG